MVEDNQHLALLDAISQELHSNIIEFNRRASGVSDKDVLIALRLEQNTVMLDLLRKHRRAIEFIAGKAIEPQMHFGEAVLLPVGGQG